MQCLIHVCYRLFILVLLGVLNQSLNVFVFIENFRIQTVGEFLIFLDDSLILVLTSGTLHMHAAENDF